MHERNSSEPRDRNPTRVYRISLSLSARRLCHKDPQGQLLLTRRRMIGTRTSTESAGMTLAIFDTVNVVRRANKNLRNRTPIGLCCATTRK